MKSGLILAILGACAAAAQDTSGLHARELFYTPPPDAAPAAPPKTPAKQATAKRTPPVQGQGSPVQTQPAPVQAQQAPAQAQQASGQAQQASAAKAQGNTAAASAAPATTALSGAHLVTVAAVPLGVRYSVLKRDGAGQFVEVDPDTTFHSGDRIRIQVKANTTGFLYVVAQGSSGTWQVLFPSSDVAGGSNRLEPGDTRQVPPGDRGQFVFDDQGGTEKLFLVLTRQAEPDLDKLIYSMGGGTPAAAGASRSLVARATVTNEVIERLRSQVASRDLVFEKEPEVDGKVENAAYVVNPSTSPDARLVVDVALKHQ